MSNHGTRYDEERKNRPHTMVVSLMRNVKENQAVEEEMIGTNERVHVRTGEPYSECFCFDGGGDGKRDLLKLGEKPETHVHGSYNEREIWKTDVR